MPLGVGHVTELPDSPNTDGAVVTGVAARESETGEAEESRRGPVERFTFAELRERYPLLNPVVVDGLLREGETCNIISTSKVGKSWLAYSLALSIITGRRWLGRFDTSPGRVLLIDNELHRGTLSHRIPTVGDALGIPRSEYEHDLEVWPLRGDLRSLPELGPDFDRVAPGTFKAIVLDAKYRFVVPGKSENDNAAETLTYNLLDRYAMQTGAGFVLIHHASKGSQTEKRVTDVGSGAGAQSRACDTHLVLREHEEPDCVVLDAALRSFAPVEPFCLRWCFPVWQPQEHMDPVLLKDRKSAGEQRQDDRDRERINKLVEALRQGPATVRVLRGRTGLSREVCNRLLDLLESQGRVTFTETIKRGNPTREYRLSDVGD